MPEPILEKDERGLVKGMLTYKDVGPTADDLLRFADNWNQIAQEAERSSDMEKKEMSQTRKMLDKLIIRETVAVKIPSDFKCPLLR